MRGTSVWLHFSPTAAAWGFSTKNEHEALQILSMLPNRCIRQRCTSFITLGSVHTWRQVSEGWEVWPSVTYWCQENGEHFCSKGEIHAVWKESSCQSTFSGPRVDRKLTVRLTKYWGVCQSLNRSETLRHLGPGEWNVDHIPGNFCQLSAGLELKEMLLHRREGLTETVLS